MAYETREDFFGRPIVAHACGSCGSPLESPLEDAGKSFPCPVCGAVLTTPGVEALAEHQRRVAARDAARAEQDAIDQNLAATRHAAEVKARALRATPKPPRLVWYGEMQCNECGYVWRSRRDTPPAKCASCSRRNIRQVLREAPTFSGGLMILATVVIAVLLVAVVMKLRA